MASQIIGGATSIIDELTPPEERQKNSFTTTIAAEDIVGTDALTKVFLLVPLAEAKRKQGSSKGYSYERDFVRCCDKPEAICSLPESEKASIKTRRKNAAALEAAVEAENTARIEQEKADEELRRAEFDASGRVEKSATVEAEKNRLLTAAKATKTRADAALAKAVEKLAKLRAATPPAAGSSRHCAGDAPITYRKNRVDDVVYVAMHFLPTTHVYDQMALFRADACAVSDTEVQRARDYVTSNDFLFYPQDIAMAYSAYSGADTLLRARQLNLKRAAGGILQLLAENGTQTDGYYDAAPSPLKSQIASVNRCLSKELLGSSPSREAWDVIKVYRNPKLSCLDKKISTEACRLDLLGHVLTRLADTTGREYSVTDEKAWKGEASVILDALHAEARRVAGTQKATVDGLLAAGCNDEEKAKKALASASVFCVDCLEKIKTSCKSVSSVAELIATAKTARVKDVGTTISDAY